MNNNSDIVDVILQSNKLIISEGLLNKLGAKNGDRIMIGYIEKENNMVPIINKDDAGNKLSGSNTVPFRGKQHDILAQFGTNFLAKENNGLIELEGDGIPIYTNVQKAVEAYITKEIILDTTYNITKLENYEF